MQKISVFFIAKQEKAKKRFPKKKTLFLFFFLEIAINRESFSVLFCHHSNIWNGKQGEEGRKMGPRSTHPPLGENRGFSHILPEFF